VKYVRSILKTNKDSHSEVNIISSIQSEQENPQGSKAPEETEQMDDLQFDKLPNSSDVLELLNSFQKMRTEEQRLLEIKQQLLAQQHGLQNKLIKEIEKKKATIANLTSEIPDLQKRTQKLGDALGVDIYQ